MCEYIKIWTLNENLHTDHKHKWNHRIWKLWPLMKHTSVSSKSTSPPWSPIASISFWPSQSSHSSWKATATTNQSKRERQQILQELKPHGKSTTLNPQCAGSTSVTTRRISLPVSFVTQELLLYTRRVALRMSQKSTSASLAQTGQMMNDVWTAARLRSYKLAPTSPRIWYSTSAQWCSCKETSRREPTPLLRTTSSGWQEPTTTRDWDSFSELLAR